MKKILFYLIFAVTGLSLQSCLHDNDEVFANSAAERINEAVANAKKVLTSSQEGWVLHYYAGRNYAFGGLNLAMKFGEGKVQMYNQTATYDGTYLSEVSTYKITRDQGPVLAFDTFNDLLHVYGDPAGTGSPTDVDGWEADYEFVIMNISDDENTITLKGKKFDNIMILERLTRPVEEYFDAAEKMSACLKDAGVLTFTTGEKKIKFCPTAVGYTVKYVDDNGEEIAVDAPSTSTDKGIIFNKPIELFNEHIAGINVTDTVTVENILTAKSMTISNDESKAITRSKDLNDLFQTGNWYITQSNMGEYGGPGFKSFVDKCKESAKEVVSYCYIGTYNNNYGFYFLSDMQWSGVAIFSVEAPMSTPDMIKFELSDYSGFGYFYSVLYNFDDALEPFLSTFKLSVDNVDKPTVWTLTDQNNAKNVIKLVKEPVLNPGQH